jgi:hypothetical protein
VVSLLPHAKKDSKVESKQSKGGQLNELVELRGCSSCLFFEVLTTHVLHSVQGSACLMKMVYTLMLAYADRRTTYNTNGHTAF